MSSARTHARNLAANWIGHGANLVVMFFLSPYLVHVLGKTDYGIWGLLTVLMGYMGLCDLGVRASTGRHITLYIGKEDHPAVDETIRTGLGFYSGLGLVVLAVGVGLGWVFPSVFKSVPASHIGMVRVLVPLLALTVWLSALQGIFASILTAHDRFDLARSVDLAVLGVQTAGFVLALREGLGILGMAVVFMACRLLGVAGSYILARRVYPRLRVWPLLLRKGRLRELMGYGLAAFLSSVSLQIIGQTGLVVAGAAIDMQAVAVYSVGATLVYYSATFLSHINITLFPAIQRAVAAGDSGSGRWLFSRATRLGMVFGLLAYIGLIVFAQPFIRLWMLGPKFDEPSVRQASLVMGILATSKLPLLLVGASVSLLNAMGRVRATAGLVIAEALLNLGLSLVFVLVLRWGVVGIAAGTLAARLAVGTFIAPWYACLKSGIGWGRYARTVIGLGLLTGVPFAAWCLLIRQVIPARSWAWFAGQALLATGGYMLLAWLILVPKADRSRFRDWVRRRVRPLPIRSIADPLDKDSSR